MYPVPELRKPLGDLALSFLCLSRLGSWVKMDWGMLGWVKLDWVKLGWVMLGWAMPLHAGRPAPMGCAGPAAGCVEIQMAGWRVSACRDGDREG